MIKSIHNWNISAGKKKRMCQIACLALGTLLVTKIGLKEQAKQLNQSFEIPEENPVQNQEIYSDILWDHMNSPRREIRRYETQEKGYYLENNNLNFFWTLSENEIADAVIRGEFGNGEERREALEEANFDYESIQTLVNLKLAGKDYTIMCPNCIFDKFTSNYLEKGSTNKSR